MGVHVPMPTAIEVSEVTERGRAISAKDRATGCRETQHPDSRHHALRGEGPIERSGLQPTPRQRQQPKTRQTSDEPSPGPIVSDEDSWVDSATLPPNALKVVSSLCVEISNGARFDRVHGLP